MLCAGAGRASGKGTLANLEMVTMDGIKDADAALRHLAALSKLSRLSIAEAHHLSTSALARLTALTALVPNRVQHWVGRCTSLLHAQHIPGILREPC